MITLYIILLVCPLVLLANPDRPHVCASDRTSSNITSDYNPCCIYCNLVCNGPQSCCGYDYDKSSCYYCEDSDTCCFNKTLATSLCCVGGCCLDCANNGAPSCEESVGSCCTTLCCGGSCCPSGYNCFKGKCCSPLKTCGDVCCSMSHVCREGECQTPYSSGESGFFVVALGIPVVVACTCFVLGWLQGSTRKQKIFSVVTYPRRRTSSNALFIASVLIVPGLFNILELTASNLCCRQGTEWMDSSSSSSESCLSIGSYQIVVMAVCSIMWVWYIASGITLAAAGVKVSFFFAAITQTETVALLLETTSKKDVGQNVCFSIVYALIFMGIGICVIFPQVFANDIIVCA